MKKLNKITLAAFLAIGLIAGASLNTQAAESLISSKDTVLKTVIATPANAKVAGLPVDAAAYSSKGAVSKATVVKPAKASISGQSINTAVYSSKAR